MEISLKAMDKTAFTAYRKQAIPAYAKDNVESGRWDESDALARSKQDLDRLLPQGVATDNHFLFNIIEQDRSRKVGHIWLKLEENMRSKSAFIYDIEIDESYRRKGYAKSALAGIEIVAAELGATSLGLHVFNYNDAAMALYKSIGYQVVSHNMQKVISS
ncbi:N-acetyltransferase [Psychromonas marina]|uniref:N-acetyltransferase n=1 Tax=Psychromonas marina TaxID=88364 RepID=A0ABQ6E3N4_9GAMM|nr:GNAT family N-acetyltransferase [Psychromonas marina]GLS92062.1 N-acetyltransferase [Psychromonas marina]